MPHMWVGLWSAHPRPLFAGAIRSRTVIYLRMVTLRKCPCVVVADQLVVEFIYGWYPIPHMATSNAKMPDQGIDPEPRTSDAPPPSGYNDAKCLAQADTGVLHRSNIVGKVKYLLVLPPHFHHPLLVSCFNAKPLEAIDEMESRFYYTSEANVDSQIRKFRSLHSNGMVLSLMFPYKYLKEQHTHNRSNDLHCDVVFRWESGDLSNIVSTIYGYVDLLEPEFAMPNIAYDSIESHVGVIRHDEDLPIPSAPPGDDSSSEDCVSEISDAPSLDLVSKIDGDTDSVASTVDPFIFPTVPLAPPCPKVPPHKCPLSGDDACIQTDPPLPPVGNRPPLPTDMTFDGFPLEAGMIFEDMHEVKETNFWRKLSRGFCCVKHQIGWRLTLMEKCPDPCCDKRRDMNNMTDLKHQSHVWKCMFESHNLPSTWALFMRQKNKKQPPGFAHPIEMTVESWRGKTFYRTMYVDFQRVEQAASAGVSEVPMEDLLNNIMGYLRRSCTINEEPDHLLNYQDVVANSAIIANLLVHAARDSYKDMGFHP